MRIALLSCLLATSSLAVAQDAMERVFTVPGALETHGVAVDGEGSFVFANETPEGDIQVTRISPDGEHQWTYKYPRSVPEGIYGNCVAYGPDGIVVVGYAIGVGTNSRDGLVLRIGLDGTLLSSERMDTGGSNALHTLNATSDGFIAGGRSDAGGNGYDMQLTKLNTLGQVQWSRYYGGPEWDWAYEAIELADGGFAMVGYGDALGTGYSPSGYLVRTDALGNEMWARTISSGNGVDEAYCVLEASNGDLYVGGRSLGYFQGNVNAFLTKLSPTGTHIWTRVLEQGIEVVDLAPGPNGGVTWLADPQYLPQGEGDYEMLWGQFSADGDLLWANLYGAAGSDNPLAITPMDDGGFSITGFTNSYGSGPLDWQTILVRTDAQGNADCHNIDLDLQWTAHTATITPYTSMTGSAFTMFPWVMGQETVAVGTYDPCCAVVGAFTAENTGQGFTWAFTDASTGAETYSWDFGDGSTSTEASPTHTYAANGTYTVCLTVNGTCNGVPTPAIACETVSVTVGIQEPGGANGRPVLFPTPASDAVTIQSPSPIREIRLIDGKGALVKTMQDIPGTRTTLPVGNLPEGFYVTRVTLANGSVHHLRLMVAH
ncbi:MAG: PKD domain-containing protein [Flavobacteriales bacterium]|nr:PKD domain-containing protein [Flavobacteriales bacterium]